MIGTRRQCPSWLFLSLVTACASDDSASRPPAPDTREIARALGCASNQVAFCVGTNCKPEDYTCVDREQALETIWPGRIP